MRGKSPVDPVKYKLDQKVLETGRAWFEDPKNMTKAAAYMRALRDAHQYTQEHVVAYSR